jgi:hypothetical protein
MSSTRSRVVVAALIVVIAALGIVRQSLEKEISAQAKGSNMVTVPRYEVDPTYPKPLPNGWYQGQTIGAAVDAQDHVWIIHRPNLDPKEKATDMKTGICCSEAPPILEFDQAGNLLRHFGGPGPGYDWPNSNHGLVIDPKGNIWIGGNGAGGANS